MRLARMRRLGAVLAALGLVVTAFTAVVTAGAPQPAQALDNGLARTPPMGWNGIIPFAHFVTASNVEAQARAIVSSGMKAAGYDYVNLDGGWDLLQRSADGELQPDPAEFPDGIKPVADYVHSLGLKFGIYTSLGTQNCFRSTTGSYGHYQQDADTFASWGVDYVKVDWCVIPYNQFPGMTHEQIAQKLYGEFGQAIQAAGRPMVYSLSTNSPGVQPWAWAPGVGNLWRTTNDGQDNYTSMVSVFTQNVQHYQDAGPGAWNDPDQLGIGHGGMTATEERSQFSLWSEMAAPLIDSSDLTSMSPATRQILTNRDVIAVDQDPLGQQGYPVTKAGGHWALTKPLANGDRAVVLFNQTDQPAVITTTAAAAGLPSQPGYLLDDLWQHHTTETSGTISADVPAHAVVMYRVSPTQMPASAPPGTVTSLTAAGTTLSPGQPATITQTFTDNGSLPVHDITPRLTLPDGWTATPSGPVRVPAVEPGQSVQQTWQVTAPTPDLPIETVTAQGAAAYTWKTPATRATVSSSLDLQAANPAITPIAHSQMTATATSEQPGFPATNAIDDNPATFWQTAFTSVRFSTPPPQSITLDLGGTYDTTGLLYQPPQDGTLYGTIFSYNIYASSDGTTFHLVASGTWPDTAAQKDAAFTAHGVRYIRLEGVQANNSRVSAAEIGIVGTPAQ